MPAPPGRGLEEGGGSDDPSSPVEASSTNFVHRRPPPSTTTAPTRPSLPPSSRSHPSPSSSCPAFCYHPYLPIISLVLLFTALLLWSCYSFLYLTQPHPSHSFSLSSNSPDLLSSHPAYLALTRQLTSQYQSLLSLAKVHMTEDQWGAFQSEAAKLDTLPPPSETAPALDCPPPPPPPDCPPLPPPCPHCGASSENVGRLGELTGKALMTDWSMNLTSPLAPDDLTLNPSYDWHSLEHEWVYCDRGVMLPYLGEMKICDPSDYRIEQWFEKGQFNIPSQRGQLVDRPHAPDCIWAPPQGYTYPVKGSRLPADVNTSAVNWLNHAVQNAYNLSMFNYGYSKNLYHFDAPFYDRQQQEKLDRVTPYIPFYDKIRNGLDIGAGGGSLSLLLHRRYNVVVLNLVYAELPYCEYITERGGLCGYISAFWSMPFAKFSYDFIHIAWLFHMHSGWGLMDKLMEVNRVLRPGGYLWWEGGFSYAQRDSVKEWAKGLGYEVVWEESVDSFDGTMFGQEKHQCDYTGIFRKASKGRIQCDTT